MTELTPGLPPDEVERLRWHAFGQKRALALRDADDLRRFVDRRGFVLVAPVAGLHYPSVLEAAVGRPLLEHVRDERAAQVERWCEECVVGRAATRAPLVDGRDTLVASEYVPDVVACGGRAGAALAAALAGDGTAPRGDPSAARVRLADRVLRNVLVVTSEELAQMLGWKEPEAHSALAALVERGDALVHPATRPRRATFQARASELLDGA
jgi:hypothetical protein